MCIAIIDNLCYYTKIITNMNRHLAKIISDSRDIKNQSFSWFRELSLTKKILVLVIPALIVFLIIKSLGSEEVSEPINKSPKVVKVAFVSDLSNNDSPVPLLGTVTSTSEATIRSETSGKLTRVYKKIGDNVVAGQVIAEFENSAERAALLQAEGAYDQAKAARAVSSVNSNINNSSIDATLAESKISALNTISNAYITMDDIVRVKTDESFSNPRNYDVKFKVSVPDVKLVYSIETSRRSIEEMLNKRESRNKILTENNDLIQELNTVQNEAQIVKDYLDLLATAYSKALVDNNYSKNYIDGASATVSSTRNSISSSISSISTSRTNLRNSITAKETSEKTINDEGSSAAVAQADAQLKSALGNYNAALSRLSKTVIRSPISGTINSISIQTGDFVSAFTEVAVVSNNGALEVISYVTEDDARRISVGGSVLIDGVIKGVVTSVASGIDPKTKKIEVRIGILENKSELINGQSVRVEVSNNSNLSSGSKIKDSKPIQIPIAALKLTPQGAFVFTVSSTSTLTYIPVKEGAILGDEIQILGGLENNMSIVTDVRGLKEGMVVEVKQN